MSTKETLDPAIRELIHIIARAAVDGYLEITAQENSDDDNKARNESGIGMRS